MRRGRGVTGDFSLRRRLMTERTSKRERVKERVSPFPTLPLSILPSISDGRGKFVCGGGLRRTSLREGEKRKVTGLATVWFRVLIQLFKHYLS